MFEINEILSNKKSLTEEEKFKILRSKRIDPQIIEYLMNKLSELDIEILTEPKDSIFELMSTGKLEGWCWETTESAIVFFDDDDYIERGNLKLDNKTPKYYHAWICFNYNGTEYVLDPCLNLLCKKEDYSKIFEIEVKGKVTAKTVREELIRQVTTPKEDTSESSKWVDAFWKKTLGEDYESYQEQKRKEVVVHAPEDVNTPLYRNGSGYKTEFQEGKIKKLTVHYYEYW